MGQTVATVVLLIHKTQKCGDVYRDKHPSGFNAPVSGSCGRPKITGTGLERVNSAPTFARWMRMERNRDADEEGGPAFQESEAACS